MDEVVKDNYEQCAKCLTTTVIWTTQTVNRYYSALHMAVLVGILMAFSIIGGYVFQQIEATHEKTNAEAILTKRGTVIDSTTSKRDFGSAQGDKNYELTILQYEGNFIKAIQNGVVLVDGEAQTLWSFGGSVYFCMTTYSLLGYGNLAPKSNLGRVIAIVYSGFCIPIASLIIGDLGNISLKVFEFIWRLISRWNYRRALRKEKKEDETANNIYPQKKRSRWRKDRLLAAQVDAMILDDNFQLYDETNERNLQSNCYKNREDLEVETFHGSAGKLDERLLLLETGHRRFAENRLDSGDIRNRESELPLLYRIVLVLINGVLTVLRKLFKNSVANLASCQWFKTRRASSAAKENDSLRSKFLTKVFIKNTPYTFVHRPFVRANRKSDGVNRKQKSSRVSESKFCKASSCAYADKGEISKHIKDIDISNGVIEKFDSIALVSYVNRCSERGYDYNQQKIDHGANRNARRATSLALKRRKGLEGMLPAREFLRSHLSQYFLASPLRWFFVIKMFIARIVAHYKLKLRGRKCENENNNADLWEDPTMADYAMFGIDDSSKAAPEVLEVKQSSVPILMTTIMSFVYIGGGSVALSLMSDQLSFFDCFWFMFISTLTVGYGDVVPADQELMIFFLLYIFICLSLMNNVSNEISSFFNANVGKLRDIGHDAVGIIKAKKEIEIKKEKSSQARKHWKIVRDRVKRRKIPRRLILESRMYKAKLLAEEREQVRWAFKIYFQYLCSLKQQEEPTEEVVVEEPVIEEPPEEPPAEETPSPSEGSVTPDELEEEPSMTEIDVVPSEITEEEPVVEEDILIITQPEEDAEREKRLTRWQRFKRFVKRVSKKSYEKTKTVTKKAIQKIKNSKLAKLFKRKKPDAEEQPSEEVKPKKKPFYFV